MKKDYVILFSLRLFLYLSVVLLIFAHPGIAVSFDKIGVIQWFIIIPVMSLLAFFPIASSNTHKKIILSLLLLIVFSIIAAGFNIGAFTPLIAGIISFTFTFLLFYFPRWAKITVLEPFFLAWVCLRLLSLSRSGEDIAGQSAALTQFILVWTLVVFLLHSAVIYLCLYPKSFAKSWKEGLVFFLSSSVLLIIFLVVMPPDFVRNSVVNNLLSEKIPPKINTSDSDRGITQRGNGRRTLPRGENGKPGLRGMSEHDWPGRGGESGENRQYMIKIVASEIEPVYMGSEFRGKLDPVEGFLITPEEQLNNLAKQRLFVTWFSNERENDLKRERKQVISLSTLQQKYLPWRPVSVDPVILNEDSGPLRYIHQVEANMYSGDPLQLVNTPSRPFNRRERTMLAHYLELPLETDDMREFTAWLNKTQENWRNNRETIIKSDRYLQQIFSGRQADESGNLPSGGNEYIEKIISLLVSFSEYQYNLNSDDSYSIAVLKHFLFNSAEGDCVEFSNALALLGRLAGIPSRVVTGYLAAESLQTIAHLRGLAALRERIPFLQQFEFDHLYMVTNIHSHSWTQFYIPDYGWLDFESTAFSQPPVGMGDFNTWDVVIPLLDDERTISQVRKFPWRAAGRAVIILIITALVCAYALRYIRELLLSAGARRGGRQGARSLYLLLLARLAADGHPIKPASKTAHEYSELFPKNKEKRTEDREQSAENKEDFCFKAFADIYSEIRWREFSDPAELENRFQLLRNEYNNILSMRKRGALHWIKRIFSLRGLAYL